MKDHPVFQLIASKEQIDQLAGDLANEYVGYFDVDVSQERDKYQDALEECLAHLEEVSSTLDEFMHNKNAIDAFVELVDKKRVPLSRLYAQVDAIEQYIFETSRLLDQLDDSLTEIFLSNFHQGSKASKIKQIISMIPGMSTMPKLGILSNRTPDGTSESSDQDLQQLAPIDGVLDKIHQVELSLSRISDELYKRMHGYVEMVQRQPELDESMASLSLNAEGNVDGSWQELL